MEEDIENSELEERLHRMTFESLDDVDAGQVVDNDMIQALVDSVDDSENPNKN